MRHSIAGFCRFPGTQVACEPPCGRVYGKAHVCMLSRKENEDLPQDPELPKLTTDWRAFRARLVANETSTKQERSFTREVEQSNADRASEGLFWAHSVSHVEAGCVLIARRGGISDASFFARAVIFIFHHDHNGTFGLVLNKQLTSSLAEVPSDASTADGKEFDMAKSDIFAQTPLLSGGPVGLENLMIVHDKPDLPEAYRVIDGVYYGGLMPAIVAVRSGQLAAHRCKFFAGYSGWSAGQLEDEIKQGAWHVAATSPEFITRYGPESGLPVREAMWSRLLEVLGEDDQD